MRQSNLRKRIELAALALLVSAAPVLAAGQSKPTVIRWVVAHDRGSSPFHDINERFAKEISEKSGGSLKVEFIKNEAPDSRIDEAAFKQVCEGQADLSQLGASAAGAPIFETPFLFRSYDHAEAAFAGPVGRELAAGISKNSGGKVRGFGFTYSGGYRILVGRKAVGSVGDFKGLRLRRATYLAPFMKQLGAELVDAGPAHRDSPIEDIAAGKVDLEETEINKLALIAEEHPEVLKQFDYANLTYHRMYVTALVANEKFFARLTAAQQKLLTKEMEALAAAERKLSIEMAAANRKVLADKGVRFVEMPAAQRKEFAAAGEEFRRQLPQFESLVREIQAVKDPNKLALR